MSKPAHVCKECGTPLTGRSKQPRQFCSTPCRQAFNNRRMQRGADLYDLFMAMRYERDKATDLGIWAIMCRMAQEYREQDARDREGRKSWQPASTVIDRLPVVMRSKDVYMRHEVFGRRPTA